MIDGLGHSGELVTAQRSTDVGKGGQVDGARARKAGRARATEHVSRTRAGDPSVLAGSYVRTHALGAVFGQNTGFKIASDPDTVRAPDLAFVDRARVTHIARRGYAALAPDLVAEILSPQDRPGEVLTKAGEWLEAGVRLVWVIDPDRRVASVYRDAGSVMTVSSDADVGGDAVLPGFSFRLAELFE
jgi:Uma2 family endonuclease